MSDIRLIKVSTSAKAKSKSKGKGKSKSKAKASSSVTIKLGRDGSKKRQDTWQRKATPTSQPIIINNVQPQMPVSDMLISRNGGFNTPTESPPPPPRADIAPPMTMSQDASYMPSVTEIPSTVPA